PFYAYYLKRTGKKHPGASEIIAGGETDWRKIVASLRTESIPSGRRIFFQKQMTHHLLPEVDRKWIVALTNCFLIRDPREVTLSFIKNIPEPPLEDLVCARQCKIFNFVRERTGKAVPVVDARAVLENPERILRTLCDAIGIPFDVAMLSWPPGLRDSDGVWAKYWYHEVARSTSFQPYQPREGNVPDRLSEIYEQCRECYEKLYQHRIY